MLFNNLNRDDLTVSPENQAFLEALAPAVREEIAMLGLTEAEVNEVLISPVASLYESGSKTYKISINKASKLKAFTVTSALSIAHAKNDSLYREYLKYNTRANMLRDKIAKKYNSQATKKARDIINGSNSQHATDLGGKPK